MKRSLAAFIAVLLPLAFALEAEGKMALKKAEACSASGCETETPGANGSLPFELFGPTIESGRRTPAPASSDGPRYRVTLTTQPVPGVPGNNVISLDYFPDAGYIHVLGKPGTEAGGASLNTGWVRLTPRELDAYDSLIAGPESSGVEASSDATDGGGVPWRTIGPLLAVVALGALMFVLALRRRARPSGSRMLGHEVGLASHDDDARSVRGHP